MSYTSRSDSTSRSPDVLDWLSPLVRRLAAEPDLGGVWNRIVDAAVTHVPGAQQASITSVRGRSVSTPAATNQLARIVDDHQYAAGEGPFLTSAQQHQHVVLVDDLHTEPRWPEFRALVLGIEVRSVLSIQLDTDTTTIGALNLYATSPQAFSDRSIHVATILATHAAVAAAAADLSAQLRDALASRDTIGQAKGILMERYKISDEVAFAFLVRASQSGNRKLRDIATDIARAPASDSQNPIGVRPSNPTGQAAGPIRPDPTREDER